jgi:hypothetical protein
MNETITKTEIEVIGSTETFNKEIFMTTDYGIFSFNEINRPVDMENSKTKELKKSMEENGFIKDYHIICKYQNQSLVIQSGHHRYTVAKHLGLPIYYSITDSSISIQDAERSSKAWSLNDYLMSYVGRGNDNYKFLMEYSKTTGIPIGTCVNILGEPYGNSIDLFKDGKFIVCKKRKKIALNIISMSGAVKEVNKVVGKHSNFIAACERVLNVKRFKVERFITKTKFSFLIKKDYHTISEFLKMIEAIYNYRESDSNKVNLAYKAERTFKLKKSIKS